MSKQVDIEAVVQNYASELAAFAYKKSGDCLQRTSFVLTEYQDTIGAVKALADVSLNCGIAFEIEPNGTEYKPSLHASNFLIAKLPNGSTSCTPIDGFFNTTSFDDKDPDNPSHFNFVDWNNFDQASTVYTQTCIDGAVKTTVAKSVRKPQTRLNPYANRAVFMGETVGKRALKALLQAPGITSKKDLPILLLESHWRH